MATSLCERQVKAAEPPDAGTPIARSESKGAASLSETLTGEAKTAYEDGRVLLAGGDFSRAYAKFVLAYNQAKDPRLLWNMSLVQKSLRHYVKAQGLLRRYLAESRTIDDADRVQAETLIKTFDVFVGTVQITTKPPNGNQVMVDGVLTGSTPLAAPLLLDLGEHELRVERDGYTPFISKIAIDSHESHQADISLSRIDDPFAACSNSMLSWVQAGRVIVQARASARVFIDDVQMGLGHTECVVPAGQHTVAVSSGLSTYLASSTITVPARGTVEVAGRAQLSMLADETREQRASRHPDTAVDSSDNEEVKPSATSGRGCGCHTVASDRDASFQLFGCAVLAMAVVARRASSRRRAIARSSQLGSRRSSRRSV